MKKKKLAIIGKGTAGAFALTHFLHWTDWDVTVYHDPNIKTQPVGEGSDLVLPSGLAVNINFQHEDLQKLDGTPKLGIKKVGWGKTGHEWVHGFPPPSVGYHFSALKFQDYVFEKCGRIAPIFFLIPLNTTVLSKNVDCSLFGAVVSI